MAESSNKTAAVIYNPIKVDLDELKRSVTEEASAAGWAETLRFGTSLADVGQEASGKALEQDFDLVILAGGFIGWIRTLAKVAWANQVVRCTKTGRELAGEQHSDGDLHYDTASEFMARFWRSEQIELDGDGFGEAVALTAWIEAGSPRVRTADCVVVA